MTEEQQLRDRFSTRLKDSIRLLKLTQAEVAEKCGLTQACISHYTTGERLPAYEELRKLCLGLSLGANYLLGVD